jgi:hypothetical protein
LNVKLEYAGIQCPEDKSYIEAFFSSYMTEEITGTIITVSRKPGQIGENISTKCICAIWHEYTLQEG